MLTAVAAISPAMAQDTIPANEVTRQSMSDVDSLRQEVAMLKGENEQRKQDDKLKSIWRRTKFFNIAYTNSTLKLEDAVDKKGKFGVGISMGNTYFLHRRPLAGMVKFGLDAVWMDINYVNYEKGDFKLDLSGITGGDYDDYDDFNDYDEGDDEFMSGSLGWHKLDIGIGVGPSVHVAPFSSFSNGLEHLRAQLYFHFTPSMSILLTSDDDETKAHYGFSPVFNFGGVISYKMIAVGLEGRWCSAKYSKLDFDDEEEGGEYEAVPEVNGNGKTKFKTSSLRAFVRFCW